MVNFLEEKRNFQRWKKLYVEKNLAINIEKVKRIFSSEVKIQKNHSLNLFRNSLINFTKLL